MRGQTDAEYVALTKVQAHIFVTSHGDLARAASGIVEPATMMSVGQGVCIAAPNRL